MSVLHHRTNLQYRYPSATDTPGHQATDSFQYPVFLPDKRQEFGFSGYKQPDWIRLILQNRLQIGYRFQPRCISLLLKAQSTVGIQQCRMEFIHQFLHGVQLVLLEFLNASKPLSPCSGFFVFLKMFLISIIKPAYSGLLPSKETPLYGT